MSTNSKNHNLQENSGYTVCVRYPKIFIAVACVLSLGALSACASSDSNSKDSKTNTSTASSSPSASSNANELKDVTVTPAEAGKAPKVDFPKPLNFTSLSARELVAGQGEQLKEGEKLTLRSATYDAKTGEVLGENFTKPQGNPQNLDANLQQQAPEFYQALLQAKIGAYLAVGIPAQPSSDPSQQNSEPNSRLFVTYVESVKTLPGKASPEEVASLDAEGKLPTVQLNSGSAPTVTIPQSPAPDKLVTKVLTEGSGQTLGPESTVEVKYIGWAWADSTKPFDSNYDKGTPAKFSLQQVIPGWGKGLEGQKVGSTVLLTIPSDLAYGDDPAGGSPAGPLVFVVEIVSAS